MEYLDLEIKIGATENDRYRVAVVRSPEGVGEPQGEMQLSRGIDAFFARMKSLESSRGIGGTVRKAGAEKTRKFVSLSEGETSPLEDAKVLGQELFDALISSEVRDSYYISRALAKRENKGLRIRLSVEAPEMAMLPWEYLLDSKDNFGPLCLSNETLFTRYLELSGASNTFRVEPPLNILGMVASPRDHVALDVEQEKKDMERAVEHLVARGYVNLTWLEGQGWRDLQKTIRSGTWHVFHFIGHGGFDTKTQEGVLALVDEQGNTDQFPASKLAELLADHTSLKLVVLNACEGSRSSAENLFSSTGSVLIQKGIPSVVAMQFEITDEAALEFSRTFYDTIAEGKPVDVSVTEARKTIAMTLRDSAEWGTPVLHMRSPDGRLFDIDMAAAIFKNVSAEPRLQTPLPGPTEKKRPFGLTSKMPKGLPILQKKVQDFWIDGVLGNSLFQSAMIDLGMEMMQGEVDDPWGMAVDRAGAASEQVPAGQSLQDVFRECGGSLLILGDPGSGKTTSMLNLARQLIEGDTPGPLPVIFNLSSWSDEHQSITDWLVDELSNKYQVPNKVGRPWIEGNKILPLLDGLDEVAETRRANCINAINDFCLNAAVGVVVCCRTNEYIALPGKLSLNSAIRLQQLSRDQVLGYVTRGAERLAGLRHLLERDSAMLIDARTPLMLSLMIRAYQDIAVEALESESFETTSARRAKLMEAYIGRMFRRAEGN